MASRIGRAFEYFLISDDHLAVWLLPLLALVCGGGAVFGSGLMGNPELSEPALSSSFTDTRRDQIALEKADTAYGVWGGPATRMSGFIIDQINENLQLADAKVTFEGKRFACALDLAEAGKALADCPAALGDPATAAATSATSATPPAKPPGGAAASQLNGAREALDRWSKRYWCTREGWDANWSQNIVRPLVARGVGGCSTLERFAARAPVTAALGLVPGIIILLVLCALAAVCAVVFSSQLLLRDAYQLAYKSKVMKE
jgi:hypothetical protein